MTLLSGPQGSTLMLMHTLQGNITVGEEEELGATVFNIQQLETLPVKAHHIREAMKADPTLSQVCRYMMSGWPSDVPEYLKPYYRRHFEMGVEVGCLFWGPRVVVPRPYQAKVLSELHSSHPGIVRMKELARMHVWWPGIFSDIKLTNYSPDCQCSKSASNCDSAPLASGHQGMGENSYRLCWSLYRVKDFSSGGHTH